MLTKFLKRKTKPKYFIIKISVTLAAILTIGSMSALTACGGGNTGQEIDETKTQLNVGNLYLGELKN